jgi:catechol 2,3-dioxygenase-like lactoylglutathione lyase family enzyme
MIRGIKIVSIPVANQERSLDFFIRKVGFKVATDRPMPPTPNDPHAPSQRWIELLIPGSDVNLALYTPRGQEDRIGSLQPVTFWCEDAFATAATLKSRGVELVCEPKREIWGSRAVFKDPDGNQFVLSSR